MSCLNVSYMHIIYVGVHYCNRDTITCGCPQMLFALWSSYFISIPIGFPYAVVALFGTSCCDVPALFISMFLRSSFFFYFYRFIHLRVLTSKCTENRGKIKNSSNATGTYDFRWVLRSFPIDPSVEVTNIHAYRQANDVSESFLFLFRKLWRVNPSKFRNRLFSPS
jgi:hypothetical protein